MKVVCISEDVKKLKELKRICLETEIFEEVYAFFNEYDVSEYLKVNVANVVFLDADIKDKSGLLCVAELRKLQPHVNVILFSETTDMTYEAFKAHASGYLLWPVTAEDVVEECEYLRFTVPKARQKVFARTFGNFELYVDGRPVLFKNGKTKELFAYLLDRGTMCANREILATLWEDDEDHNSYLKKLRVDLLETLNWLGCDDVIIKNRGELGINLKKLSSDLFEWTNKTEEGDQVFNGEYMSQYTWAEERLAYFIGENQKRQCVM